MRPFAPGWIFPLVCLLAPLAATARPELRPAVVSAQIVTSALTAYDSQRAPYSFRVNATGGNGTYSWYCTGLPAGLSCDAAGNITGTTSVANGTYPVDVTVIPSLSPGDTRTFPLQVYTTPAILTPSPLPDGFLGVNYGTVIFQDAGVSGTESWAVTAGTLPPGLTLSGATLSGTPTLAGAYSFTITLTDGVTVNANYTLQVSPRVVPPFWLQRGLAGGVLSNLFFSPLFALDKTVFAFNSGGTTLYISTDGGYYWTALAFKPAAGSFQQIALPPSFDGRPGGDHTVLAGISGANTLYRSTNLGQSWTAFPAVAPTVLSGCYFLAYDPGMAGRVIALMTDSGVNKVMVSTDLANWTARSAGPNSKLLMSSGFATDQTLFAVGSSGESTWLKRSTDGGYTFQDIATGLGAFYGSVALSPNFGVDHTMAMTGPGGGLLISYDGGTSFSGTGGNGVADPIIFPSDYNPQLKPWIFATTPGFAGKQLLLSRDGGLSFNPTGTGGMPTAAFSGTYFLSPTFGQDFTIIAEGQTGTGMYRSEDGGATWGPADNGLYLQIFNCAAFAPNSASTIFAGTAQGVYYSTNAGASWRLSAAGVGVAWPLSVSSLAVSPDFANDKTVFAYAFDNTSYSGFVLRSTDGGLSFSNPNGTNFPSNPYSYRDRLAVSPNYAVDGRVFISAGLISGYWNFYVSYNRGVSFVATGPGFNGAVAINDATRFAVSPSYATDQTIWLIDRNPNPVALRSSDGGTLFYTPAGPWPAYSWLAPVLSPDYNHAAALSGTNHTLFVGCAVTADDGASFSAMPVCGNVYAAPTYPATGLLYVTDNGNNYWDTGGTGLFRHSTAIPAYTALTPPAGASFASVSQVAFSPAFATDNTLVVAGGGGLFLSHDGGDTFTVLTGGDSTATQVTAVAPDPNLSGRLYLGTNSNGVYMSTDDGASGISITRNLPVSAPVQPVNDLNASGSPTTLFAALATGLYRRTDFSATGNWSQAAIGDFRRLQWDAASGTLYASRADGPSLKSTDGGLIWTQLAAANLADGVSIVRVPGGSGFADGAAASLWAASVAGGARYSTTDGAAWTAANGGNDYTLPALTTWTAIQPTGINATTGGREVLIGGTTGLFLSRDGADTWRNVSGAGSGLEATSKNISALLTSPTAFGTTDILVGASGSTTGGVYLSGDGGEHWIQINQGFDPNNLSISSLVKTSCSGCPVQYYSGSYGGGLYTRTITVTAPPAFPAALYACFGATGCSCATGGGSGSEQGGQGFRLCGNNFQNGAVVEFDGVPATGCTVVSGGVITCTATPPHAPGSARLRVRNPDTRTGYLPANYLYTAGTSRAVNFRLLKAGGNVQLSWNCAGCTAASPARIYRGQNALFTAYLESYNGGVGGTYTNTGAASSAQNYFWSVE